MRITKSGKIKLGRDDVRVGNFVFHDEREHVKVSDINEICSVRIHKMLTSGGVQVSAALEQKKDKFLEVWSKVMWYACSSFIDEELVRDLVDAVNRCKERHKDIFGVSDEVPQEEDAKVLDEVKQDIDLKENIDKEVYGK